MTLTSSGEGTFRNEGFDGEAADEALLKVGQIALLLEESWEQQLLSAGRRPVLCPRSSPPTPWVRFRTPQPGEPHLGHPPKASDLPPVEG